MVVILASVLLVTFLGAQITYYLIHHRHVSTVRASAAPTLVFAILISLTPMPDPLILQAAFFGSTFVGMTDSSRLGWRRVGLASIIFGLVFTFLIPLVRGYGGGLGAAAFASSSAVYFSSKFLVRCVKRCQR